MGMNSHLLQVDPGLARRLRYDPQLVERLVLAHSIELGRRIGGDVGEGVGDDLDALLSEHLPAALWRWWPLAVRRFLLRRVVSRVFAAGSLAATAAPAAELALADALATTPALASVGGTSSRGGTWPTPTSATPARDAAPRGRVIDLQSAAANHSRAGAGPVRDDGASVVTFPAVVRPSRQIGPIGGGGRRAGNPPAEPLPAAGEALTLDKDWHVVHYLLSGSVTEVPQGLGGAVLGGDPLPADFGYGPPRLLDPDTVRAIAAGFRATSPKHILRRWDVGAMTAGGVYSAASVDRRLARRRLAALARFYERAARADHAVLAWLI